MNGSIGMIAVMTGGNVTNDDDDLLCWKIKEICRGIDCNITCKNIPQKDRIYRKIVIEYYDKITGEL